MFRIFKLIRPLIEEENKNEIHNINQNEIVDKEEDIQAKESAKKKEVYIL